MGLLKEVWSGFKEGFREGLEIHQETKRRLEAAFDDEYNKLLLDQPQVNYTDPVDWDDVENNHLKMKVYLSNMTKLRDNLKKQMTKEIKTQVEKERLKG